MRIAVNTRFLMSNKLEGIGWFTHEVLKRWVEWHPEHEFIFIFDRPFSDEFIFAENVTGVDIFPPARHPLLFYWWYEWSIPKVLKKYKPDVFVSPDGFISLRTKVPTLMVLHDIAWKHFPKHVYYSAMKYYNYYVPKFIKGATRLATVSQFSKDDIINSYGADASKIDVVYNGSHKNYQPLTESEQNEIRTTHTEGQPYFLYLGSINPRKNVPNLIRAFNQFKEKTSAPTKLVLVGRIRKGEGEIGALLSASKFEKDIILPGYISNELLPKIIASAYALTYVSLFEGFGIPLLEAMYCEVPSITSNCSSMPEVVGDAALLVDPSSVEDISQKMVQLWTDKNLRNALVEKGKIQRQNFSWDLTAHKMWDSLLKTIED
jgi:glycosyltransferase involved in cell wall biosynthesis